MAVGPLALPGGLPPGVPPAAAGGNVIPFRRQAPAEPPPAPEPRKLSSLKKAFTNAVGAKWAENAEAAEAERYFHGVQWSAENLRILKDRGQPPVTYNRIKRKINTICGVLERQRMDPKAYPRNPQRQAEDGAEVATKVLNYALGWQWGKNATTVARKTCIRGLSGAELVLAGGDQGDPDIEWDLVDQRDFFYDPRSVKPDFSDARFMGTTRWIDYDEAVEAWPDKEQELEDYVERNPVVEYDRGDERHQIHWYDVDRKRIRIVDHWYMRGSEWHYAIYCGEVFLEWNRTYLRDEKGRDVHKYEMVSYEIDQDGDRYGAYRDLKSPQDEINQRRSKAMHQLASRKVIADAGAVDDVELARREYARADGWVVKNPGKEVITEDQAAQAVIEGNLTMLQEAKSEIDTYGPNPGLIGTDIPADSGRAIQLLQAAGIAELGDFIMTYKDWRLRVYRKTWNAVQQIWQAPRWIRVTDDENMQQFIEVNGLQKDPVTGGVQILNELSALDVDIVIDEGGDAITTMADTFDTLVALGKGGAQIPPEMFIELSPLPSTVKQRIMQQLAQAQQPKPPDLMAMQLELQGAQAKIEELMSKARLNDANAQKAMIEAQTPEAGGQQVDTPADMAKARLDQAKAMEIEQRITNPVVEPTEPGLWEVNSAKAREHDARAELARTQAQMGWSELETQRAEQGLKGAQTWAAMEQARKTREETETIRQAPPGMLTQPPPQRTSVPSAGRR